MSQSQPVPSDEIQRPDDSSNQGATVARGAVFKFASAYWRVAAVVLLAGVLPWVAAMVARSILRGTYVHELLHECMELAGTCIALAVATLLWLRSQYEKEAPHLMWAAAALVAMGLIDGAHGVVPFGLAWSWLRHSATLVGGLLFAMVWVARPRLEVRRKKFFLSAVAVLSLALALFIGWKPGLFPAPWRAGDYTFAVKAANGLGGLGFLMASMFFLRRYLRQTQTEDIVLASQTMLFGVAGLMFGYSHVWHSGWWVWHGARLAAYGIVLMTAYEVMERAEEEVRVLSETVKEERQRLHDVLNLLPAYVVLLSKDYHVLFANRYFEEQFGKAEGRRCYEYLFQRSQPCENCETYKVLKTNAPHGWEWTGPNGRDYDIHDFPFIDSDGATLILEMGIDITERKAAEERLRYLNRSLRALSDCNQLLLHSPDEPTLLDGVCRILVEHCGHALAWVGYPEQDEAKSVRVAGAAGVAKDYLTPGLVSWADEERGRGPTGTAIRTGKAVTLEDASTDPRFGPWREQALSRGFHSSVCLPVLIGETVPAGLTIYSTQRGAFQGEELKLLVRNQRRRQRHRV